MVGGGQEVPPHTEYELIHHLMVMVGVVVVMVVVMVVVGVVMVVKTPDVAQKMSQAG